MYYIIRYLDDVGPSLGRVIRFVEGIESASEYVRYVGRLDNSIDLLHSPLLVQVIKMSAVKFHFPAPRNIYGRLQNIPINK